METTTTQLDQGSKGRATNTLQDVSRIHIRESAENRLKVLVGELSDPSAWPSLKSSYTTTRLRNLTIARLKQEHFQPGVFPSGSLSSWIFVLEESHRLRHIESAMDFVLEARKFCRKVITVTSDVGLFAGVCRLLKPGERT